MKGQIMKTIQYPAPQVITIFVPVFGRGIVKLRQMILSDDWVQDCYDADQKYGVWYTTAEQALAHFDFGGKLEL